MTLAFSLLTTLLPVKDFMHIQYIIVVSDKEMSINATSGYKQVLINKNSLPIIYAHVNVRQLSHHSLVLNNTTS